MKVKHLFENSVDADIERAKETARFLLSECPHFFSSYNFAKRPLFRGISRPLRMEIAFTPETWSATPSVMMGVVKRNRKPVSMPRVLHEAYNEEFERKFGIKARSETLFCSSESIAESYGTPCLIVPVGDFKILSSKYIMDLWNDTWFDASSNLIKIANKKPTFKKSLMKLFKVEEKGESLEDVILYSQTSFDTITEATGLSIEEYVKELASLIVPLYTDDKKRIASFDKNGEVMLSCDTYYAVPLYRPEFSQTLIKALSKN